VTLNWKGLKNASERGSHTLNNILDNHVTKHWNYEYSENVESIQGSMKDGHMIFQSCDISIDKWLLGEYGWMF
jgi:hypothetical protein